MLTCAVDMRYMHKEKNGVTGRTHSYVDTNLQQALSGPVAVSW
jgi:hypothetical protein